MFQCSGSVKILMRKQYFQQDGASTRTANYAPMAWLHKKFGEHLISCIAKVECAPHSPDPNLPGFLLVGVPQAQHLSG